MNADQRKSNVRSEFIWVHLWLPGFLVARRVLRVFVSQFSVYFFSFWAEPTVMLSEMSSAIA